METSPEDMPIDEILQQIRNAIIDNERKKYFRQFLPKKVKTDDDIFILSQNMMVNREDIPYQLGVWSFDDVAKKMMKKYRIYFTTQWQERYRLQNISNQKLVEMGRVSVKEDNL